MPGDGPALLGMPDIELLNIVRITYKVIGVPKQSRKFDLQTVEAFYSHSCRTSITLWNITDKADAHDNNTDLPDYFRSSTNRAADKGASEILTNKIHNEFNDIFPSIDHFEGTFTLQVKDGS